MKVAWTDPIPDVYYRFRSDITPHRLRKGQTLVVGGLKSSFLYPNHVLDRAFRSYSSPVFDFASFVLPARPADSSVELALNAQGISARYSGLR